MWNTGKIINWTETVRTMLVEHQNFICTRVSLKKQYINMRKICYVQIVFCSRARGYFNKTFHFFDFWVFFSQMAGYGDLFISFPSVDWLLLTMIGTKINTLVRRLSCHYLFGHRLMSLNDRRETRCKKFFNNINTDNPIYPLIHGHTAKQTLPYSPRSGSQKWIKKVTRMNRFNSFVTVHFCPFVYLVSIIHA